MKRTEGSAMSPGRVKPTEDFCCAKCHGRRASTRRADIGKGGISDLLPLKSPGRYLFVTCSLCGYTEMFDTAVTAEAPAPAAARKGAEDVVGET
jgi:predicted nucleic-acid-binding Zn-ribbon protein